MKILITGISGYIGSNLARSLISDHDIYGLVREESNLDYIYDLRGKLSLFVIDDSYISIENVILSTKPDLVIHLATYYTYDHKSTDVDQLIKSNLQFGTHILEAMSKFRCNYFLNVSTVFEHYNSEEFNPVNLYSATKKAFRDILKFYIEAKNIKALTLFLSDTFGPHDNRKKILNTILNAPENSHFEMTTGQQEVDFIYITDVIEAFKVGISLLIKNESQNQEYYVISNNSISLKNFILTALKVFDKKLIINWGGKDFGERVVMTTYRSTRILPNWSPLVSYEEGLRKMRDEKFIKRTQENSTSF